MQAEVQSAGPKPATRRRRSVPPARIAKVIEALGRAVSVRLNTDGSVDLLANPDGALMNSDPVERDLAAWRVKLNG